MEKEILEEKTRRNRIEKKIDPAGTVDGQIRIPLKKKLPETSKDISIAKDAVKPTKRAREIADYHIAIAMMKTFKYMPWMTHKTVTGPNHEKIAVGGKIYIDDSLVPKIKFKRKYRN